MKRFAIHYIVLAIATLLISGSAKAWSEHPLMAYQVLSTIPELNSQDSITVKSLKNFLLEQEKELEKFFAEQEVWLSKNLTYYPATPEHLKFKATGNPDDILERFFRAIRLNPNVKMKLYLHLLPFEEVGNRNTVPPQLLTTVKDVSGLTNTNYVELLEGDLVSPLAVLYSANDEPDYGFDLGLFSDNNTPQGNEYGFGEQPFGDPNLEYGSQAPFHMGFYHEAKIVLLFGPFLKKTLPELRINQFRSLAEFAFASGNQYWGYRFMGWAMHYLGDLSMPYHSVALPGVSPLKMIWTNIKAMLGFPKSRDNAVQIVSNRHAALEEYQWQALRAAYNTGNMNHPLLAALRNPIDIVEYDKDFPRYVVAKESADRAKSIDKTLKIWMPEQLVLDPEFETPGSKEISQIITTMKSEKGDEAIEAMDKSLTELFRSYSMHLISFYNAITKQ